MLEKGGGQYHWNLQVIIRTPQNINLLFVNKLQHSNCEKKQLLFNL